MAVIKRKAIPKAKHNEGSPEQPEIMSMNFADIDFRPAMSKQLSRTFGKPSELSIVNTEGHGKRIALSVAIRKNIGSPDEVQIAFNDRGMFLGEYFPGIDNSFTLRKSGNKSVIYSKELVEEVTKLFDLDFTNRTTISFYEVQYMKIEGIPIAFVPIVNPEQVQKDELDEVSDEVALPDEDATLSAEGDIPPE